MKQTINKLIPVSLKNALRTTLEKRKINKISVIPCNTHSLLRLNQITLNRIFGSQKIEHEWNDVEKKTAVFAIPDGTGGVNPGDRRAIYYLTRKFQPRSVLEIGTHIGASTVYIAIALKQLKKFKNKNVLRLVSVDINDVNDPTSKPWLEFGTTYSPKKMINMLGCGDFVTFIKNNSLDYISECDFKFDFIFLDGSHTAEIVYQEIPAALNLLNNDGMILLHDFFPKLRPLWPNGKLIPGPYLAVERLKSEGANIKVLPLGNLPWPTKLGSNTTSLTLLSRD